MTLVVRSMQVTADRPLRDVTTMMDAHQRFEHDGPLTVKFEISGICTESDDYLVLRKIWEEIGSGLDLLRAVASCEWCGSLYPRAELRCKRGCGGPRT